MSILIVGCGYVGTALAKAWVARGETVIGTRRTPQGTKALEAEGLTPMRLDLSDPPKSLPPADWVYVLVSGNHGELLPGGLQNLLSLLRDRPPRKLIYTSSTVVYGEHSGAWVDEGSARQARHLAASHLMAAEDLVLSASEQSGVPGVLARVSGIYGPNRIIGRDRVLNGEPIPGDPQGFLNLIHRDDLVSGLMALAERGRAGEAYLFSDDLPVIRAEYYRFLAERIGVGAVAFGGTSRKELSGSRRCRNQKIKRELGLALKFPTYRQGVEVLLREGGGDGGGPSLAGNGSGGYASGPH